MLTPSPPMCCLWLLARCIASTAQSSRAKIPYYHHILIILLLYYIYIATIIAILSAYCKKSLTVLSAYYAHIVRILACCPHPLHTLLPKRQIPRQTIDLSTLNRRKMTHITPICNVKTLQYNKKRRKSDSLIATGTFFLYQYHIYNLLKSAT